MPLLPAGCLIDSWRIVTWLLLRSSTAPDRLLYPGWTRDIIVSMTGKQQHFGRGDHAAGANINHVPAVRPPLVSLNSSVFGTFAGSSYHSVQVCTFKSLLTYPAHKAGQVRLMTQTGLLHGTLHALLTSGQQTRGCFCCPIASTK